MELAMASLALVDPCLDLMPRTEMEPSSERSEESSSPLTMRSQDLHSRNEPACPKYFPGTSDVHFESNI